MAATLTPAAQHDQAPSFPAGKAGVPGGKMQKWYIDRRGREVRTVEPVPVDGDNRRTAHVRHACRKGGCDHHNWQLPNGPRRFCPDHGVALVAPKAKRDRGQMVAKEAGRLHGQSAGPWAVLVATAGTGVYVKVAVVSAGSVVPLVPAAAGVAYVVAKQLAKRRAIKLGRIEKGQTDGGRQVRRVEATARTAGLVAGAAATWVTMAAATDPHTTPGRIVWVGLAAAWAVGSVPAWRRADRRRRADSATVAAPAAIAAPPKVDPVELLATSTWDRLIGKPDGPLAGTHLEGFAKLPPCLAGGDRRRPPNWSATVRANVPGSMNMREIRPTLLGRIAAAYGCTYGDVAFIADAHDLSVAYLQVRPDNPLAEVRRWGGPSQSDWGAGRSVIGRFDDGAPIPYLWWSETGAIHELISGCTGSGKSELVVQLLLASLQSKGLVLDWVGDPQGGQSYGAVKDKVDWFARNVTEIKLMLLAAKVEMLRRNDVLSQRNQKTWKATKEMPLLVLTLDELQSYIDDAEILVLVTDLVGQARKCGIKVRIITQVPSVGNLGGSTYIKEQLKAGQAFIFRAATDIAGRLAVDGDSPIDPTQLPATWGQHTCGFGKTTAGVLFVQGALARDVYGRADWTGEDMDCWLVDEWGADITSPAQFGPDAQQASGVLWAGRIARSRVALEAGRDPENLLPGGKALALLEQADQLQHGPMKRDDDLNPRPTGATPVKAADALLSAARDVVGAQGGQLTKEQLVAATPDIKASTRDKAIDDLLAAGQITRTGRGVYQIPRT